MDLPRAVETADAAAARAEAAGDRVATALARTAAAKMSLWTRQGSADETERSAREALPLLEAAGDDAGLASIWETLALVANTRARCADWARGGEAALTDFRRAGRPVRHTSGVSVALAFGPRRASEALAALDALLPEQPYPGDLMVRALLLAMDGRTEDAWAVALPAEEHARELGHRFEAGWMAEIARVAGDLPAAAAYKKTACDAMEEIGATGSLAGAAAAYSHALCRLGRHDEAEALAEKACRLAGPDDISTQTEWRQAKALIHSARAQHAEAGHVAREAVYWAKRSDSPVIQGDALHDLGEVLEAASRRDEPIAAWQEALDRYERKQIIPLAHRVRERLAALRAAAPG